MRSAIITVRRLFAGQAVADYSSTYPLPCARSSSLSPPNGRITHTSFGPWPLMLQDRILAETEDPWISS